MNHVLLRSIVAVAAMIATACGRSAPAEQTPPPAVTPPSPADVAAQAAQGMQQALQQMGQQTAKAVDFEQLIALLPEASGWTRSKPRGEQTSMGITVSQAKARYEKGESSIDLSITDSSFNQLVMAPFTMFLKAGFSERSTEGYTKSAPLGGNPGFEKWNSDSRRAEVGVVVGNRFIVQATGNNVENADPVRALVQAVDLKKLASLK